MASGAFPQHDYLARARALHQRAIVIDTHADTVQRLLDEGGDLSQRSAIGQLDLPRMREGGVAAEVFAVWAEPRFGPRFLPRALAQISCLLDQIERHPNAMRLATTAAEIRAAHKAGRVAALLSVEGGHTLEGEPRVLDVFCRLGVRMMTLTWSNSTDWAGSSGDDGRDRGLSAFGREIVARMNRLGMIVDVSHVSDPTFHDVLEASSAPVVASHSCCRALCDAPRNLSDEMIRSLAARGGVIHINFYPAFLDAGYAAAMCVLDLEYKRGKAELRARFEHDPAAYAAAKREMDAGFIEKLPRVGLSRVADHIEHAVRIAGPEHVGIGSDFDGASMPADLQDVSRVPWLTAELLRRGMSEADVEKILGGNFLRVLEAARTRMNTDQTGRRRTRRNADQN